MKSSSLSRLMSYLGRDRWLFGLAVLLDMGWVIANTLGITYSVKIIMNAASTHSLPMLITGVKCISATAAALAVFGASGGYLVSLVTERASKNARERLFQRALRGTSAYLDAHESGDTLSRLVNDIEVAKQGYATLHSAASQLGQIVFSLGTLAIWSWPIAVTVLVFAGLCLAASSAFAKPIKSVSQKYQSAIARVTESATNVLSGVAMVKGLNAERAVAGRFDGVNSNHLSVGRTRARLLGAQSGVMNAMPFMALAGMMYVAGSAVFAGSQPAGDAVALIQLSSRSLFPFTMLGSIWATLQQNLAAADRVDEALKIPQEQQISTPANAEKPSVSLDGVPSIEFRDVSFGYNSDKPVLENVNFRLRGGSRMALHGSSGSGKTTILKLLLGMYAPRAGSITLGDLDVRSLPLETLRGSIAIVPQEPWLFPGTVRENILLGKPGSGHEEVARAAALAHADEFIEALPEGYDTVLDERGRNLSGGQRQRLCLARAFLKDAPVLFLDEPTSAVDAESERMIREAVERLAEGRTVVTIAHTAGMLDGADLRVELEGGRAIAT